MKTQSDMTKIPFVPSSFLTMLDDLPLFANGFVAQSTNLLGLKSHVKKWLGLKPHDTFLYFSPFF